MEIVKTLTCYSAIVVVTVLFIQCALCEIPDDIRDYIELRLKDLNEKHEAELMKLKLSFQKELKQQDGSCRKNMDVLHNRIQSLEDLVKNAFDECMTKKKVRITEQVTRDMDPKNEKRHSGIDPAFKGVVKRHDGMVTKVAFSATLTLNASHLNYNELIKFDQILTNIGNAYDPKYGIFTAPVGGTYVFSFTLRSTNISSYFVVYNAVIATLNMHPANGYTQGSHTVIVSMEKGHQASVRSSEVDTSIYGDRCSSFSGFLLFEDLAHEIVG